MADRERTRTELIRFLGTVARSGQTLDDVGDDENLIDAGVIDSLAMVQIIVHLEKDHGVDLRMGSIDPTARFESCTAHHSSGQSSACACNLLRPIKLLYAKPRGTFFRRSRRAVRGFPRSSPS